MNIGKIVNQIEIFTFPPLFKYGERLNLSDQEKNTVRYTVITKNKIRDMLIKDKTHYCYTAFCALGYAHIEKNKCFKMSVSRFITANHIIGYHDEWTSPNIFDEIVNKGGDNCEYYLLPIKTSHKKLIWSINDKRSR